MNWQGMVLSLAIAFFGFNLSEACRADRSTDSAPTSRKSPEGVATDLVQSFISRDFHGFNDVRAKHVCEGRTDPFNFYVGFRNFTTLFMNGEPLHEAGFPSQLMRISRVYAARPLKTKEDLEVAGAFRLGWHPTLVDVVIEDRLGNELLHRTLAFKANKDSELWYAQPQLYTHDYLNELLMKLPKSELVLWQPVESSQRSK